MCRGESTAFSMNFAYAAAAWTLNRRRTSKSVRGLRSYYQIRENTSEKEGMFVDYS